MKTLICTLAGSLLLVASVVTTAADGMKMGMDMKMMDANSDGMVSKDEYMAYHEKMWTSMKKNSMGMVDPKMDSMKSDGMKKDQ